mmetsp:Transcript_48245/g.145814  ORF Transcript_48245/g.145814 Transcript_48245/m.145814 type:complete len:391 (+) Transcript_48245:949-2121(+)
MAEGSPVVPIVLVKGILDGYNGVLGNHLLVEGNELVTSKKFGRILIRSRGLEVKVVLILILDLELRRGDIKANRNLVSIPSLLGSLHAHVNAGLDIAGRGEATLVTDEGGVTTELALDDLFEVVEDLAANFHGLGESAGTGGDDEELLESELVASVLTTIDHIEARNRQSLGGGVSSNISIVLPEGDTLRGSSGLGGSKRHSEDGVCAEVALVGGSIGLDHNVVDAPLISRVHALDGIGEGAVDVLYCPKHALPHVPAPTVAQFGGLIDAGGSSRGDRGCEGAVGGGDVNLNGRVTTGVDNFTPDDVGNRRHRPLLGGLGGDAASKEGGGLRGNHGYDLSCSIMVDRWGKSNGAFVLRLLEQTNKSQSSRGTRSCTQQKRRHPSRVGCTT